MAKNHKPDANWSNEVQRPVSAAFERAGRRAVYGAASVLLKYCSSNPPDLAAFSLGQCRKILLIKEPYRMGDLMQITPLIRALRTAYPQMFIGLVIQDRNLRIFQHNPDISKLYLYKKKEINHAPWKIFSFFAEIRKEQFDLAVTLETQRTHLTNDLIALFSGAPRRLRYDGNAFDGADSNIFYNMLSPYDAALAHEIDRNFGVLQRFGLALKERGLRLTISDDDEQSAKRAIETIFAKHGIKPGSPFAVILPGAYKIQNRWPLKNYMSVARRLEEKGLVPLFMLGPAEEKLADELIRNEFPLALKNPVLEAAAIFQLSKLVLTNDTGLMHIAAGVGAKTVALFGETNPSQWKPPGEIVVSVQSSDNKISSISEQQVLDAIFSQFTD